MMIESRDTPLTLPAMFGSQRLIVLALAAVAQLNINASLCQVPLNRGLVLSSIELRQNALIDLSWQRDIASLQI